MNKSVKPGGLTDVQERRRSSRAVLGDGLGALGDGVLGELSGEEEADSGLDLSGREGVLLVVADELGGLEGDLLEDVSNEGVEDVHASLGDAGLGVDLLEDSVDVDREALDSAAVSLGSSLGDLSGGGALGGAGSLLGSHVGN